MTTKPFESIEELDAAFPTIRTLAVTARRYFEVEAELEQARQETWRLGTKVEESEANCANANELYQSAIAELEEERAARIDAERGEPDRHLANIYELLTRGTSAASVHDLFDNEEPRYERVIQKVEELRNEYKRLRESVENSDRLREETIRALSSELGVGAEETQAEADARNAEQRQFQVRYRLGRWLAAGYERSHDRYLDASARDTYELRDAHDFDANGKPGVAWCVEVIAGNLDDAKIRALDLAEAES